jgi:rhamnose utilization protein RhaD (predicted bifunctional aldolase and dehydrogenase)
MPEGDEILEQLTALSHHLGDPDRDYAMLGEGNTSARVDEESFFVKASGQQLGTITPAGFCQVSFARVLPALDGPDLKDTEVKAVLQDSRMEGGSSAMPSVETFLHAYLLTLPGIQFVGHTHPTAINSILCSRISRELVTGRLFPDEIVCCGVAPCYVEYVDPGIVLAKQLKRRVEEYREEYGELPKAIWMENHGFIAIAPTPKDVRTITAMAVKAARILIGTYALGGPRFLTPEHVSRIHTRPDEHYRQKQIRGEGV